MTRKISNGNVIRYYNSCGKRHREDGPAIVYSDGRKFWFLNGESMPFEKYLHINTTLTKEEKSLLILKYS